MLSRTSKQEVLTRLSGKVGYSVNEGSLSPATRQAIANLAAVQRNLFVISEVVRGERNRVQRNAFLALSSRLHGDRKLKAHAEEIDILQGELNTKLNELSVQIIQEDKARESGQPIPQREGGLQAVELKCPSCGADLPLPTGRLVECQYCKATLSIQTLGPQIKTAIQSI